MNTANLQMKVSVQQQEEQVHQRISVSKEITP